MLLFTLDQLVFLRKAVTLVEQMLLTKKKPLPNVNFALETVTQVQAKLNQMIIQGVWGVDIGFDFLRAAFVELCYPISQTNQADS